MNRIGDTRISTLLSHISRARTRDNLTMRANCVVDRLILDHGRVRGVQFADGRTEDAECVALCAGSIGSPAILMRSGIGPKRDLEAVEIQSTIDLPGLAHACGIMRPFQSDWCHTSTNALSAVIHASRSWPGLLRQARRRPTICNL
jgi:choline dehydrogenase-like flavoprotein